MLKGDGEWAMGNATHGRLGDCGSASSNSNHND